MERNSIIAEAISIITNNLLREQSDEEFYSLLEKYGLYGLIDYKTDYFYDTQKNGKIILFGDCKLKKEVINGCLKSLGIEKSRFEYVPYDEVTNYNFKNLEYNSNYRLILVGPMPHSAKNMGNESSIIEWLLKNKNIAKTIMLDNLKVTKTSFKNAIKEQIDSGYLVNG